VESDISFINIEMAVNRKDKALLKVYLFIVVRVSLTYTATGIYI
jgi:hypothetical protein